MYTNKTVALGTAPLGKPHRPQYPQWRGKSPMLLCCGTVRVLLKHSRGMQVCIWIYSLVKAQSAASFALYEAQLWASLAACLCVFNAVMEGSPCAINVGAASNVALLRTRDHETCRILCLVWQGQRLCYREKLVYSLFRAVRGACPQL